VTSFIVQDRKYEESGYTHIKMGKKAKLSVSLFFSARGCLNIDIYVQY
jgi:hypothetical protein